MARSTVPRDVPDNLAVLKMGVRGRPGVPVILKGRRRQQPPPPDQPFGTARPDRAAQMAEFRRVERERIALAKDPHRTGPLPKLPKLPEGRPAVEAPEDMPSEADLMLAGITDLNESENHKDHVPFDIRPAPRTSYPGVYNPRHRAFLSAFRYGMSQTKALRIAGMTANSLRELKARDAHFLAAFTEAQAEAGERLEEEARRRATEGYERPVYQRGELVGTETVYSDRLMEVLLKGNIPEKYNPAAKVQVESAGAPQQTINALVIQNLAQMNPEALAALQAAFLQVAPTLAAPALPAAEHIIDAQAEPYPETE